MSETCSRNISFTTAAEIIVKDTTSMNNNTDRQSLGNIYIPNIKLSIGNKQNHHQSARPLHQKNRKAEIQVPNVPVNSLHMIIFKFGCWNYLFHLKELVVDLLVNTLLLHSNIYLYQAKNRIQQSHQTSQPINKLRAGFTSEGNFWCANDYFLSIKLSPSPVGVCCIGETRDGQ